MKRKIYSTDLSDEEWELMSELVPPAKYGGRPRTIDIRDNSQCRLLYLASRLCMAIAAARFSVLENRLSLLARVAHWWFVGTNKRDAAPESAKKARSRGGTFGGGD